MLCQLHAEQISHLHAQAKVLSSDPGIAARLEGLCVIVKQICGASSAFITLTGQARYWSSPALLEGATERYLALGDEPIRSNLSIIIGDARYDSRYCNLPLVLDTEGMRFFVGIPIHSQDGTPVGALCITDKKAHVPTPAQMRALDAPVREIEAVLHGVRERHQLALPEAPIEVILNSQEAPRKDRRGTGGERRKSVAHDPLPVSLSHPTGHGRTSTPSFSESERPGIFYLIDQHGKLVGWNHQLEAVTGYSHEEIAQLHPTRFFETDPAKSIFKDNIKTAFREGRVDVEADLLTKSGAKIRYFLTGSKVMLQGVPYVSGTGIDISASHRSNEARQLQHRAVHASTNPIIITDLAGLIEYVNPAFESMTGYSSAEVVGRNCTLLQGQGTTQAEINRLREAIRNKTDGHAILRNYRKDGELFWNKVQIGPVINHQGHVTHFVGVLNDITDLKRHEAQLELRANFDSLTRLANRALLKDRIRQAMAHAQRHAEIVIVGFVDLDKFKAINDRLGHQVGDDVLRTVAERLLACVRAQDTVARYGGDEFAFVLTEQPSEEHVTVLMQRILATIAQPLQVGSHTLSVSCSIGMSQYPRDGLDVDTLLKHADVAMYRAKEFGRNNYQFYTGAP